MRISAEEESTIIKQSQFMDDSDTITKETVHFEETDECIKCIVRTKGRVQLYGLGYITRGFPLGNNLVPEQKTRHGNYD
jgi:hypothetical protein